MKQFIIVICILLSGFVAFAQKEKKDIHRGNEFYEQKKYAEAEASYKKSVEKSKESVQGNFNLGDALFKQKKFDNAVQQFTEIAGSSKDKGVKAQAYHNLGNSLMESKKLEESIEAYKKSLMNNPKDEETRYNLAYAQEKLKQQQQQNKDNKDKDKDKKDKNDKNKKDQDKDNKDNKDKNDKDKQDKDKQDQNKDQNKDKKDQDKKDQQNGEQPQPDKLSKEDAERMLEALKNEEKNTQDKLKNKKAKGVKGHIVKDW